MTDDIDRAQAREAEMLSDALRNQARRAGLSGKTPADSAEFRQARGCGEEIPDARRPAPEGARRSVLCGVPGAPGKERQPVNPLQVDFWQLVGFGGALLSGFAAIIFGAGRLIAAQFEARINERFDVLQKAREAEAQGISNLERDFLRFQADLPLHYVRREDYVRGQSIVEAKLDGLATKIDNAQLRASMNERGSP